MPMRTSGTTSSALKAAPIAMIDVGVPAKYRWWNVPGIPAKRNIALDAMTAAPACDRCTSPRRAKMMAAAAVANTSKKPSTHRCTTHQRQYSITVRCVRALKKNPAPYITGSDGVIGDHNKNERFPLNLQLNRSMPGFDVDTQGLEPVMRQLASLGGRSITSTPPTLEEMFLRLYGDETS